VERVSKTSGSLNTDAAFVFTDLLSLLIRMTIHLALHSVHILSAYNSTVEMQSITIKRAECKELRYYTSTQSSIRWRCWRLVISWIL